MKKFFVAIAFAFLLCSCGVGSYTVSSGKEDIGYISFTSNNPGPITVTVDGTSYETYSVKTKAWQPDRKIKETAKYAVSLTPGTHEVTVVSYGKQVFQKKVFISATEHRIIDL